MEHSADINGVLTCYIKQEWLHAHLNRLICSAFEQLASSPQPNPVESLNLLWACALHIQKFFEKCMVRLVSQNIRRYQPNSFQTLPPKITI